MMDIFEEINFKNNNNNSALVLIGAMVHEHDKIVIADFY